MTRYIYDDDKDEYYDSVDGLFVDVERELNELDKDLDAALSFLIMQMGQNNAVKMLSEQDAKRLIQKYKPEVFR